MLKTLIAVTLIALGLASWQTARLDQPVLHLKEEKLTIEYTATADEAVLIMEAEAELDLASVIVRSPSGVTVLEMNSGDGAPLALSGFVVETRECTPEELFLQYPAGRYDLTGRTLEGRVARGSAQLSHDLPRVPTVNYPFEGATQVPTEGLEITWNVDTSARAYRLVLEQNDNDGLVVTLPAGSTSFQVPDHLLAANTETQLEVGAVAANGNCTLVEIVFKTR